MSDPTATSHGDERPPADPPSAMPVGEPASPTYVAAQHDVASTPVRDEVYFASPQAGDTVDELLLESPRRRRWLLPLVLFLTTCLTTFYAGVYHWPQGVFPRAIAPCWVIWHD